MKGEFFCASPEKSSFRPPCKIIWWYYHVCEVYSFNGNIRHMPKYEYTYIHVCCHFHPSGGDDLTFYGSMYVIPNDKYQICLMWTSGRLFYFIISYICNRNKTCMYVLMHLCSIAYIAVTLLDSINPNTW